MCQPSMKIAYLRWFGSAAVKPRTKLSLRESREERAERGIRLGPEGRVHGAEKSLPGRYRVRPSRAREGCSAQLTIDTHVEDAEAILDSFLSAERSGQPAKRLSSRLTTLSTASCAVTSAVEMTTSAAVGSS